MPLQPFSSPYLHNHKQVRSDMLQVLAALLPALAAYAWLFGWGVVVNLAVAAVVAVGAEALMLRARRADVRRLLADGSTLVTAALLTMALPPLAPWWLVAVGIVFAIVVAKQLYGGLGYNPFNPAMVGFVVLLVSFPGEMTTWLAPLALRDEALGLGGTLSYSFTGTLPAGMSFDAITAATPLDAMKVGLGLGRSAEEVRAAAGIFGRVGGIGWEWVSAFTLVGGLWLLWRGVIGWQVPVGMLGSIFLIDLGLWLLEPASHPGPFFQLLSGATMLGAFFIATDPVSGCTTPLGRLLFGIGVGVFTDLIRHFGIYPDGVAFAVLLMNVAAPAIDHLTRPRAFGH